MEILLSLGEGSYIIYLQCIRVVATGLHLSQSEYTLPCVQG